MAFVIFAISMILIYIRPFGFPAWASALAGGIATIIFGVVSIFSGFWSFDDGMGLYAGASSADYHRYGFRKDGIF